jgi:hypothetical protein
MTTIESLKSQKKRITDRISLIKLEIKSKVEKLNLKKLGI